MLKKSGEFLKRCGALIQLLLIICAVLVILSQASCVAADIVFQATVNKKTVVMGEAIQLNLTFTGTQGIQAPQLPPLDGFQSQYIGPATSLSIVNGQSSSSITHRYFLIPQRTGQLQVGPFEITIEGQVYNSAAIQVEVVEDSGGASASKTAEGGANQLPARLDQRVFAAMEVSKTSVYVNEIFPAVVKLYVGGVPVRDVQFPDLSSQGFSMDGFAIPVQSRHSKDGLMYDVVDFTTHLFATKTGELELGPAHIKLNAMVAHHRPAPDHLENFFGGDFFNRLMAAGYETVAMDLPTGVTKITVKELPVQDKPENFTGGVGDFKMDRAATPTKVAVGDPITITVRITGSGNLKSVSVPRFPDDAGFKVYEPTMKMEKESVTFEQVVIPQKDQLKEIPAMTMACFSPVSERYYVLSAPPIPLDVTKPANALPAKVVGGTNQEGSTLARQDEALGSDILYIKEFPGQLRTQTSTVIESPFYWAGFGFMPVLVGFFYASLRRQQKLRTDVRYARRRRAPRHVRQGVKSLKALLITDSPQAFYNVLYDVLRRYLGDRFHLGGGVITASTIADLRVAGVLTAETEGKIARLLCDCDAARYSPGQFGADKKQESYQLILEIFDECETGVRRKTSRGFLRACGILLYAGSVAWANQAGAVEPSKECGIESQQAFFRGNGFYKTGQYDKAILEYRSIVDAGLSSGPLFYNLGNAYFKTNDVGQAILHYEKARRLIPRDPELTANLKFVREEAGLEQMPSGWKGLLARLFNPWMLNELAVFVLLCFSLSVGFVSSIVLFGYRRIWLSACTGCVLFIFLAASFSLYDKIKTQGRAGVIVAADLHARFEPTESATPYFPLKTGQVIILLDKTRDWSKIKRSDGKSGWVPAQTITII